MCLSIYKLTNVMKLCMAAQNVQKLIDEGTLAECFGRNKNGEAHECIVGFNLLAESAQAVLDDTKDVSPFLRYRKEILGDYDTAVRLRAMVMNLWGGSPCNLSLLFMNADSHHTRIAMECIASYTHKGENDKHFMELASEIREREESQVAS